jgi:hypothetical protein
VDISLLRIVNGLLSSSSYFSYSYPNIVEKLLLISPAGVGERPTDEELKEKAKNSGWLYNLASKVWEMDISPQGIVRGLGPLGKTLLSGLLY